MKVCSARDSVRPDTWAMHQLRRSVAPGSIATERIAGLRGKPLEEIASSPQPEIPVGRIGRVEEFADVAVFLCSERASYVCGVNLVVDGGLTRGI